MASTDKLAQQTKAIEISAEQGNAATAIKITLAPVISGNLIKMWLNVSVVSFHIVFVICLASKTVKCLIVRKIFYSAEFKLIQSNMGPVQIDCGNFSRISG